jgi:hypothetical protein
MKRTTIYFDPELEVRLKLETQRQGRPMAELVREAVEVYLTAQPEAAPPGAGAFASGRTDTAADVDRALSDSGFGSLPARKTRARKAPARKRRT